MIRLDNVKVSFKDKVAVDLGRVIEIADGERVGIIGEQRCWKDYASKEYYRSGSS